jgi:hypothetical protein
MTDELEQITPDSAAKSSFFEQLVEHVFIAEILQEAWYRHRQTVEVLRSEVDASGYDLVLECGGILRHVQLKTSGIDAKAGFQKVNIALAQKPSGCVIWLYREENAETCRMLLRYRFFGGKPGEPLPVLDHFKVARHTKGNSTGLKRERLAIKKVPKGQFEKLPSVGAVLTRLFGLPETTPALFPPEL